MALRLFLPLLLLAAALVTAQAQGFGGSATDCCLKHSKNVVPRARVISYRHQGPESGCMLHAVVLTTKKGRQICASPTDPTVQGIIQNLEKKVKNKGQFQNSGGRPKPRRRQRI